MKNTAKHRHTARGKELSALKTAVLLSAALLFLWSCSSVPSEAPVEWSIDEINRQAQTYMDKGNYKAAEFMYQTLIQRYGTDMSVLASSEYELAHIKIKQKKWAEAKPMLEKVLSYYDSPDSSSLPPEFKKLAAIDLEKIPERFKEQSPEAAAGQL